MAYQLTSTVDKTWLLEVLRENRRKHREVFEAALDGYGRKAAEILEGRLDDLRKGRVRELRIILDRPADHTRDYDRIIGMVQRDQGGSFTLDEQMYARYVDDDWDWKRAWVRMSNTYAAAATSASYGTGDENDEF